MAQDYVFGDAIEALKAPAFRFVSERLSIAQNYVELATNGAFMGVCFVFGNSKQVVKVAEDVQKVVKRTRSGFGVTNHGVSRKIERTYDQLMNWTL